MALLSILLDLPAQARLPSSFAIRTDETIATLCLLPAVGESTQPPATNWLRAWRNDADGYGVPEVVSGAGDSFRPDRAVSVMLCHCPVVLATESEGRRAAIVDFTFNLDAGRLQASMLRRRINQRNWISAGQELH